ncbi:MAG: hypothetical protein AMQ74_01869 [Candidatus Methanofastidiosum methylothiophilum]|uniref:Uncharacterized protein n=1 Tax=Candidatus Methanofastidiosum methylothiophilum TaxID=1705564 RepID=A0A150IM79_9EURY|nr:MAG: hypothetical protein AMQ74_01869 [Candidatus Methanofastidiosum methylthiophilus]
MGDKSFVTLDVCIICGEPKGIAIDRRMQQRFEMETILEIEPCDKCKEKYLKEGVMMIHIGDDKSFDLLVINEEAFKNLFDVLIPEGRIVRCDKEVLSKLREMDDEAKKREEKV